MYSLLELAEEAPLSQLMLTVSPVLVKSMKEMNSKRNPALSFSATATEKFWSFRELLKNLDVDGVFFLKFEKNKSIAATFDIGGHLSQEEKIKLICMFSARTITHTFHKPLRNNSMLLSSSPNFCRLLKDLLQL